MGKLVPFTFLCLCCSTFSQAAQGMFITDHGTSRTRVCDNSNQTRCVMRVKVAELSRHTNLFTFVFLRLLLQTRHYFSRKRNWFKRREQRTPRWVRGGKITTRLWMSVGVCVFTRIVRVIKGQWRSLGPVRSVNYLFFGKKFLKKLSLLKKLIAGWIKPR